MNIARYVLERLEAHGCNVLFGIPGTSCAALFQEAPAAGVNVVLTSSELEAGYAADGYARVRGLAAVSVSYGVGTLSMVNAIAGALVERGPVVVVNGGPSAQDLWLERHRDALFSHSTGRAATDLRVFEQVTVFAARGETAGELPALVDRAITTALREQRPVYIEIPRDLWTAPCGPPQGSLDASRAPTGLEQGSAGEVVKRLRAAVRPAILLGEEIARYRLQDQAVALIRATGLPWATTLLGKGILPEATPNFVGVYDSDLAPKPVRDVIEGSDLLLALGCVFGVDQTLLVTGSWSRMVHAHDGVVRIQETPPARAELREFLDALAASAEPLPNVRLAASVATAGSDYTSRRSWAARSDADDGPLSYESLFATIDAQVSKNNWFVVVDTCLASYPAADLAIAEPGRFMGNPVWLSIGHSLGAAVGVSFATNAPVLVLCGDGGFQMTAQAVSTLSRYKRDALVVVIDNGTYAIEQYLIDPRYFTDPHHPELPYVRLNAWDYPAVAKALGAGFTASARDPGAVEKALEEAQKTGGTALLSVSIDPRDLPPENKAPLAAAPSATEKTQSQFTATGSSDRAIANFDGLIVVAGEGAEGDAERRGGANIMRLDRTRAARVVVQKGRSFQRANPHVQVLVDRGRFLVVDLPAGVPLHQDPGSFGIAPADAGPVSFQVERRTPRPRRAEIADVVAQLSANGLEEKVRALAALRTRHSLLPAFVPALDLAESWLAPAVDSVRRVELPMDGGRTANLIGSRAGTAERPRLFVIGAHLDSTNRDAGPEAVAPGADDNASGSATVIAIAQATAGLSLRDDVHFVLFGGEEQGLFGSKAYVAALSPADRRRLAGMVNIDMAASKNTAEPSVLLEGAELSRALVESLADAAATYTRLITQVSFKPFASDHVPFIEARIPAVLTIEGADDAYTHEHTERDTPDRLDFALHREITAMDLAWLLSETL